MQCAIPAARSGRLVGLIATAALLACGAAAAAEDKPAEPPPTAATDAATFCANIGDAARDARAAWETQTLNALKMEIERKTAALDAKRVELEDWVKRRDDFRKLAEETIVDIYARMRPEAAAQQLAALDAETAAAVLVKLNARVAGAILSEMDTPRAVTLASLISASANAQDEATQP